MSDTLVLDRIESNLTRLRLPRIREILPAVMKRAEDQGTSYLRLLDDLLEEEVAQKEQRRIETTLKISGLPFIKSIDEFDFTFQPKLDRLLHHSTVINIRGNSYRLKGKNSNEAWEILEQEHVDLVILDVVMPKMTGFDVCRQIRARQDEKSRVKIIMLTAKSDPRDQEIGEEAGSDLYLTKPIDPRKLKELIRGTLGDQPR